MQKYTGSPTGTGNPPGKHSKGYLGSQSDRSHFVNKGNYRGSMNVGRSDSASDIGNQPKQSSAASLGLRTKSI